MGAFGASSTHGTTLTRQSPLNLACKPCSPEVRPIPLITGRRRRGTDTVTSQSSRSPPAVACEGKSATSLPPRSPRKLGFQTLDLAREVERRLIFSDGRRSLRPAMMRGSPTRVLQAGGHPDADLLVDVADGLPAFFLLDR